MTDDDLRRIINADCNKSGRGGQNEKTTSCIVGNYKVSL